MLFTYHFRQRMQPSPLHLERAHQGYSWCRACGENNLAPDEPHWKDTCSACHDAGKPKVYCQACGDPIERSTLDWARRKKADVKRCYYCRKKITGPHPVHGVILPTRFYSTLS